MDFFFVLMADTQFGMFASLSGLDKTAIEGLGRRHGFKIKPTPKVTGFADETALYEKAIAATNRLNPDFAIMCGDMTHDPEDQRQLAELMRITGRLDDDIPWYWVSGNHDLDGVGNGPTSEAIARYRERFGEDNYSFDRHGSHFIVLNSSVCFDPSNVWEEWEQLLGFLKSDLKKACDNGSNHNVVFSHHPLFTRYPVEEDDWIVIPRERRLVLLDLFKEYGVSTVFSAHWHRNNYSFDGSLEMVTSGAVGYPLGADPSGFRIVKVYEDRIEHEYFGFDELPEVVEL